MSIQNDVTSRIAFEEALRESEKLAASIAHEINNPLEAITNLLYLMRGKSWDPEAESYLAMTEKELQDVSTSPLNLYGSIGSRPRRRRYVLSI